MSFYFGIAIQRLTIVDAGHGMISSMVFYPLSNFDESYKNNEIRFPIALRELDARFREYALVNLAGYAAEYKYLKRRLPYNLIFPNENGDPDKPINDYSKIYAQMAQAHKLLGADRYSYISFYFWEVETRKIIRKKNVWQAIEALAKLMLRKMKSVEKSEISLEGKVVERVLAKYIQKPTEKSLISFL